MSAVPAPAIGASFPRLRRKDYTVSLNLQWALERKLAEDAGRPIIFYAGAASCWQPAVRGFALMVNSVFNSYRYEDIWLDR